MRKECVYGSIVGKSDGSISTVDKGTGRIVTISGVDKQVFDWDDRRALPPYLETSETDHCLLADVVDGEMKAEKLPSVSMSRDIAGYCFRCERMVMASMMVLREPEDWVSFVREEPEGEELKDETGGVLSGLRCLLRRR